MQKSRFSTVGTVLVALLTLSCLNPSIPPGQSESLVLVGGRLIDGTGSPPLSDATIVIRDERIRDVGIGSSVPVPDHSRVIDLEGATILPGFINAHVHRGYDASRLRAWAAAGVTTVRDLGAQFDESLFATRDRLMADDENARLVAAGPLVTVPGGYPIVPWGAASALPVDSVDDAREQTTRVMDAGADLVKIALERGQIFGRTIPTLSAEEAATICALAHARGTVVSAHVTAAVDLELALAAGVDHVAHMVVTPLADALIEHLVRDESLTRMQLVIHDGVIIVDHQSRSR